MVLYSLEYGTPVRYGSTRIYYSYGTVPALFTIRFGRAETVPVLYYKVWEKLYLYQGLSPGYLPG